MMIINNRVYVTEDELDRVAVQAAAERTGLSMVDVRAAVVAYMNALERQEEACREFNRNGRDRW